MVFLEDIGKCNRFAYGTLLIKSKAFFGWIFSEKMLFKSRIKEKPAVAGL